jgi:hypothetical protein
VSSVSGLSTAHRIIARDRAVNAAILGLHKGPALHYTQDSRRWQGIDDHLVAALGHFPDYSDCSSFATWCLWNGLHLPFGCKDFVNGTDWKAGFTGTMLDHGKQVHHIADVQKADCVIYGTGYPGHHTAIVVGRRSDGAPMVASHGGESVHYLAYDQMGQSIMQIRRYI